MAWERISKRRMWQATAAVVASLGLGLCAFTVVLGDQAPARVLAFLEDPLAVLGQRSPGLRAAGELLNTKAARSGLAKSPTSGKPEERVLAQVRERPGAPAGPSEAVAPVFAAPLAGPLGEIGSPDAPLAYANAGPLGGLGPAPFGGVGPSGMSGPGILSVPAVSDGPGATTPDGGGVPDSFGPPGSDTPPTVGAPPTGSTPPAGVAGTAVPEPAAWLMMIAGLFCMGAALRIRRTGSAGDLDSRHGA